MILRFVIAAGAIAVCGQALALSLDLPPRAVLTAEDIAPGNDIAFPVEPVSGTNAATERARGTVTRRVWRIESSALTPLQIIDGLRDQLIAAGYTVNFECADRACGGFDFRFALDLIGEPDMHVDLGDYRYLAARQETDGDVYAMALVASRSANSGFLHVTEVTPNGSPISVLTPSEGLSATGSEELADRLLSQGRAVLSDLNFETGSADLAQGNYQSLSALSEFLAARPTTKIMLVGHTDAAGALDSNIALSKARAGSVRARLIEEFAVSPQQVSADGIGFLMPLAPNTTEDGRKVNRRVEAVLLDLE
jgi:OOP family OmpA-OmpF porin